MLKIILNFTFFKLSLNQSTNKKKKLWKGAWHDQFMMSKTQNSKDSLLSSNTQKMQNVIKTHQIDCVLWTSGFKNIIIKITESIKKTSKVYTLAYTLVLRFTWCKQDQTTDKIMCLITTRVTGTNVRCLRRCRPNTQRRYRLPVCTSFDSGNTGSQSVLVLTAAQCRLSVCARLDSS